jgi:hypothetical protein
MDGLNVALRNGRIQFERQSMDCVQKFLSKRCMNRSVALYTALARERFRGQTDAKVTFSTVLKTRMASVLFTLINHFKVLNNKVLF